MRLHRRTFTALYCELLCSCWFLCAALPDWDRFSAQSGNTGTSTIQPVLTDWAGNRAQFGNPCPVSAEEGGREIARGTARRRREREREREREIAEQQSVGGFSHVSSVLCGPAMRRSHHGLFTERRRGGLRV